MSSAAQRARTSRRAAAGSLAIDAATIEAVDALAAAGVEAVLLKGPALVELLYEAGETRPYDDADLLVRSSCRERALELLAGIGFAPRISDPVGQGSVPYAVHLVRPSSTAGEARPASIDLHVGFAGVADADALWASIAGDRDTVTLFGRSIDVPSAPARLALVAIHGAAHGGAGERSLGDLKRALARFDDAAWASAWDLARSWSARDFFVAGMRLDPAGEELLARLGVEHEPSVAARMRGRGMPRAQRSLEQLGRERGAGARLRLAWHKAFPSPEVMREWKPIARRGPAGLALAYALRPPWLIAQLGVAAVAYVRARLT